MQSAHFLFGAGAFRGWRLYLNPGCLESLLADEAAATILHEVSHLLLKHHKRTERFASLQDRASWKRWNHAADSAVDSKLIAEGIQIGDDWVAWTSATWVCRSA